MSVIKQISVYDGSSWTLNDIGVNAENVALSSSVVLSDILPTSKLTTSRVLISDGNGKIAPSGISTTLFNTALNGASSSTSLQSQINTINTNLGKKVAKTGDTMTGSLTISPGNIWTYSSNINVNANPSTTISGSGLRLCDVNGTQIAGVLPRKNTSGTQSVVLGTSRTIGANSYANNLYLHIASNGTKSIGFSSGDDETWRDALGINGSIGTINFDSVTCNSGSTATFSREVSGRADSKIVFSPGTYIVVTMASIPYGNANGYRWIWWANASNGGNIDRHCIKKEAPCTGGNVVTLVNLFNFTASTTYWLKMSQNSGSSISNCYAGVKYLRIHT